MKFEQLLRDYIGEWGRYQKTYIVLVSLPTLFTAIHALSWTFTSYPLNHRCILQDEDVNWPYSPVGRYNLKNLTVPFTDIECARYQGWTLENYYEPTRKNLSEEVKEYCPGQYKYDFSEMTSSAISEFEIVCDRAWIRAFIQSMYYVGQFLGSIVFGILGDKFGRKLVFIGAIILQCVSGTAMAFVPHWTAFAILRVLVGFCHPGIFVVAVVIGSCFYSFYNQSQEFTLQSETNGMELVGPQHRKVASVITGAFYAIGQMILGAIAYGVRDFKTLQMAISIPGFIFAFYWWVVPESARWLISQQRYPEAHKILERAARWNGRSLHSNWHEELDEETATKKEGSEGEKKYGFFDMFRIATVRRRILLCYVLWPVVSGVYYGLSMNPTFFGGNFFTTFIAAGFMEIPGLILSFLTLDRWGRKFLCFLGYFTTALCLFSTLFIPESIQWLKAVQVIISKMAITTVYATVYTFTPELFPTAVRNTALGSCSMMARIGAVSASYISMYLAEVNLVAMVVIYAGSAFAACLACLLLPETAGLRLPETFDDIKDTKLFLPFFFTSKIRPLFTPVVTTGCHKVAMILLYS